MVKACCKFTAIIDKSDGILLDYTGRTIKRPVIEVKQYLFKFSFFD